MRCEYGVFAVKLPDDLCCAVPRRHETVQSIKAL
jgi:hypothetical protein